MPSEKAEAALYTVGRYICPKTKAPAPLMASSSLAFIEWPVVVEKCANCGEKHVIRCEDVQHAPVYGYE